MAKDPIEESIEIEFVVPAGVAKPNAFDSERLRVWLISRPSRYSLLLVARTALRALPHLWASQVKKNDVSNFLPHLRAILIVFVVFHERIEENKLHDALDIASDALRQIKYPQPYSGKNAARATYGAAENALAYLRYLSSAYPGNDEMVISCVNGVHAASQFSGASIWNSLASDIKLIESKTDPMITPLWHGESSVFAHIWPSIKKSWQFAENDWSFWIEWYQAILDGRPQNIDMLTEIALIPSKDWEMGEDHVNGMIAGIVKRYRSEAEVAKVLDSDLLKAAFADFTFDSIRNLMVMVAFEEDIRHLRDPARLAKFLDDADELVTSIEDFRTAISSAQVPRQGAGEVSACLNSILMELGRSRQMQHLRVGLLIDYGATLQDYSLDDGCRMGLGDPMAKRLDRLVGTMLGLTRAHFAASLVRIKPLETLALAPNEKPQDILDLLDRAIARIGKANGENFVPLAEEDLAILKSLRDELARIVRGIATTSDPSVKIELEREFAKKSGQMSVTVARYTLRAKQVGKDFREALEWLAKTFGSAKNLFGLIEWIGKLIDKIDGIT